MVVHNRRTWIRECWVGCGIVSPTAELSTAWAWGAQEDRCWELMTVQVLSFLCCAPKQYVFASWAQCVNVMRTFWCLTVFCRALSIYRTNRSPGGTFPCVLLKASTAVPDCICILGLALFSPTHHNSHKKEEQDLLPGRQGGIEEVWHELIPKWIFQFPIYDETLWRIFG